MHRIASCALALLVLLTPQAWAAGKPGLWTVTTTWQFGMKLVPPALMALARQQGLKPPVTGQPFLHHMCMTVDEADGSQPPHLNSRDLDCVNRLVSLRGGRMILESICHGPLEGVGRAQITWRGNLHFDGTYDFKGRFRSDATAMSSSFSADWAGADCRGVRPFIPQSN
jgi:Protein of unknown function (DUF3617)